MNHEPQTRLDEQQRVNSLEEGGLLSTGFQDLRFKERSLSQVDHLVDISQLAMHDLLVFDCPTDYLGEQ
jgi:hypothetical protein